MRRAMLTAGSGRRLLLGDERPYVSTGTGATVYVAWTDIPTAATAGTITEVRIQKGPDDLTGFYLFTCYLSGFDVLARAVSGPHSIEGPAGEYVLTTSMGVQLGDRLGLWVSPSSQLVPLVSTSSDDGVKITWRTSGPPTPGWKAGGILSSEGTQTGPLAIACYG